MAPLLVGIQRTVILFAGFCVHGKRHGFQLIQNRSSKGFVPHNVSWLSSSGRSYFQVVSRFPHTVQRSHSQHQGAVVILRQFKHSKMPHRVELMRDKEVSICPVRALEDLTNLRGGVDGALFSTPGGKPYATSTARDDLASVISFCGLDTKRYKSHSFRIGAASDAALKGFSDAQIRLMGRWRSDAFRQYIRLPY